ncbi:hypothetical protein ACJRO7_034706 [Eucalyptus globulus]|uniref:O-acyltransferase WSD1 C-terminal domain-containing protein n=1 Tax=Eucalyptus globulus TaxID=34317 RepID=A0ABD3J782_EUCGL
MGSLENGSDEPLTPEGRLFLQKEMNQVIYCAIGMKQPLDVDALKLAIQSCPMYTHPRFCSLLVRDSAGREHWRRTRVEIYRHVVPVHGPVAEGLSDEAAVNKFLADLSTDSPGLMGDDKPLWDVHLLMAHQCMVVRIHHALGDGTSLISSFLAGSRLVDDPEALPTIGPSLSMMKRRSDGGGEWWKAVVRVLEVVWFTVVFVVEFVLRTMWVSDRTTPVSGGAGVELWPRKLATARFSLEDLKVVKSAVANAELSNMMKGNPGLRWGNKFGIILLPVHYSRSFGDPLEYLRKAKSMMDRKKKSLEAHFSYKIGDMAMTFLGAHVASLLNYRIFCNTTFSISNVYGPREELTFGGNPITYIRATTSSLPHVRLQNTRASSSVVSRMKSLSGLMWGV